MGKRQEVVLVTRHLAAPLFVLGFAVCLTVSGILAEREMRTIERNYPAMVAARERRLRCLVTVYDSTANELEGGQVTCRGETLRVGMVGVDPRVIPLGSTLLFDGKRYIAADVGGAIKGCRIDVFVPGSDTNRALWRKESVDVMVLNGGR